MYLLRVKCYQTYFYRIVFLDKLHAICIRCRSYRYSGMFLKKKHMSKLV